MHAGVSFEAEARSVAYPRGARRRGPHIGRAGERRGSRRLSDRRYNLDGGLAGDGQAGRVLYSSRSRRRACISLTIARQPPTSCICDIWVELSRSFLRIEAKRFSLSAVTAHREGGGRAGALSRLRVARSAHTLTDTDLGARSPSPVTLSSLQPTRRWVSHSPEEPEKNPSDPASRIKTTNRLKSLVGVQGLEPWTR
jgi:hypothetical protein